MTDDEETSTDTILNSMEVGVQASVDMVEKSINAVVRVTSKRTQWSYMDAISKDVSPEMDVASVQATQRSPLLVKVQSPKRVKNKECNTTYSFPPHVFVEMGIVHTESDAEKDAEMDKEDSESNLYDSSFHADSVVESDCDDTSDEETDQKIKNPRNSGKSYFLVEWSCLLQLFRCLTCMRPTHVSKQLVKGTLLVVHLICSLGHAHKWSSQSFISVTLEWWHALN